MILISELYEKYCDEPSDINEHLPTLKNLVKGLDHLTEMGVRTGLSTIALLHGMKEGARLVSFDIVGNEEIEGIAKITKDEGVKWNFRCEDTLKVDIEYTDFLFIDTWHCYDQLIAELTRHAPKVKKYIAMHDTTSFGEVGEIWHEYPCIKDHYDGLNKAIDEFLAANKERSIKKVYKNNNGLTILERNKEPSLDKPTTRKKIKLKKGEQVIYTAIMGGHDILKKQPEQDTKCRFICFTDGPLKIEVGAQREVIERKEFQHLHPRMRAKRFRTHPDELFEGEGRVIYMDGSGKLLKKDSVKKLAKQFDKDILCFDHPLRDCIYDEAMFCMTNKKALLKYEGLPLIEQVQFYKDNGHPEHWGLSATGWLMYDINNKDTIQFLHDWWTENLAWTYQDQLSFDYLVRKNGIKRKRLKENQRDNDIISFLHPHLIAT